jgi:hypothetical protein
MKVHRFIVCIVLFILALAAGVQGQEIIVGAPLFYAPSVSGEGHLELRQSKPGTIGSLVYSKTKPVWSGLVFTASHIITLRDTSVIRLTLASPLAGQGWKLTIQRDQPGIPMEAELRPGLAEYVISFSDFTVPDWYLQQNDSNAKKYLDINQVLLSTPFDGMSGSCEIVSIGITLGESKAPPTVGTTGPKVEPANTGARATPLIIHSGVTLTGYTATAYDDGASLSQILKAYSGAQINILATLYANADGYVEVDTARTPKAGSVSKIMSIAHQYGSAAGLYLYVDPKDGSWRASEEISIDSWRRALESYLAGLSETPDFVALSSEMVRNEYGYDQQWRDLIQSIRKKWPQAKIGYATDRNSPMLDGDLPSWVSDLTYLGVTAWCNGSNIEELSARISELIRKGKTMAARARESFFIGEIGYPSQETALESPFTLTNSRPDAQLQEKAYRAVLPIIQGCLSFLWRLEPDRLGDPIDYSFIGKPAEKPILDWLKGETATAPQPAGSTTNPAPAAPSAVDTASITLFVLPHPVAVAKVNPRYLIDDTTGGIERMIGTFTVKAGTAISIKGSGYSVADSSYAKGSVLIRIAGRTAEQAPLEYRSIQAETEFSITLKPETDAAISIILTASDWGAVLTALKVVQQ